MRPQTRFTTLAKPFASPMGNEMSTKDLQEALNGPKGSIDAYLEIVDEAEFRADVLGLSANNDSERRQFAAMAMQGLLADNSDCTEVAYAKQVLGMMEHETYIPSRDWPRYVAMKAVAHADALIAELAKAAE